jgi:hypothetical protein
MDLRQCALLTWPLGVDRPTVCFCTHQICHGHAAVPRALPDVHTVPTESRRLDDQTARCGIGVLRWGGRAVSRASRAISNWTACRN